MPQVSPTALDEEIGFMVIPYQQSFKTSCLTPKRKRMEQQSLTVIREIVKSERSLLALDIVTQINGCLSQRGIIGANLMPLRHLPKGFRR